MIIIFEYGLFGGMFPWIYFIVRPLGEIDMDLSDAKTFFYGGQKRRLIFDKPLRETVIIKLGTRYGCNEVEPSARMINSPE
jgi:hypothetical protein